MLCGYCGRLTHATRVWTNFVRPEGSTAYYVQGAAACDNCHRASIGARTLDPSETPTSVEQRFEAFVDRLTWYPRKAASPDFPDVPEHIARAAKEAHESHSINALMASILMARTVVEASAKEKGITSGTLVAKIDGMQQQDLIRKSTAEAAHEIRHFGNDMAHGDIADLPSADDAAEVLALMDEVLNEVFQGPARTERIKARRTGTPTA